MRIGLLIVATNKYIKFVPPLLKSAAEFLLPRHQVTPFVFTNMPDVPQGAIRIEQEHLPWPGPTLQRYSMFVKNADTLKTQDYLYYCDADMRFSAPVEDEILGDSVATIHPGFYNKPQVLFSYERNPKSRAYIEYGHGRRYYAGGFNGGRRENFM